jgi:L-serine dehydratase
MLAAGEFVSDLAGRGVLLNFSRVQVDLYGSLALTGRGHGTDRAVILALYGEHPEAVDPRTIDSRLATIRELCMLPLRGLHAVGFIEIRDLIFNKEKTLPRHSNGMCFRAYSEPDQLLEEQEFYSIGGGFIVREGSVSVRTPIPAVPYPFGSATELLHRCEESGMAIWKQMLENEQRWRSENQIQGYIAKMWDVMRECVLRGLGTEGILRGGLNVWLRARKLAKRLEQMEREVAASLRRRRTVRRGSYQPSHTTMRNSLRVLRRKGLFRFFLCGRDLHLV